MDRPEDADADDEGGQDGGFSDLEGDEAGEEAWFNGSGDSDGDEAGDDAGDEAGDDAGDDAGALPSNYDPNWDPGEGGEPRPGAALRQQRIPPGYDPNWDPGEGGEPRMAAGDDAGDEAYGDEAYGDEAGDEAGDDGGFSSMGDDAGEENPDAGPEEGESRDAEQADDAAEPGPEDQDAPPPRPPAKKRSLAKRIYRGARRAHSLARQLSPSHQLAKRIPGLKRFARFMGDEGPAIGIGADCAPECGDVVTFDLYKSGKGWSGVVRVPTDAGRALMMSTSPSATKAQAANKAVNLTKLAASTPMLQAMVPPQARLALMAAKHPLAKKALRKAFKL